MQIASFEASWPVLSAIKWSRQYHAMLASPLRVGDVLIGHQAFIAFRMLMTASVSRRDRRIRGRTPRSDPRDSRRRARRNRVCGTDRRVGAYTENEASFVAIFRFLILPMFLFSGTFFPIEQLPRRSSTWRTSLRSGTGSTSPGS